MAHRRSIIGVASALLVFLMHDAYAWGRGGHRTVCLTAWADLSGSTRDKVRALLDIQTAEQFAGMCSWADEVRRDRPETAAWHFLDVAPEIRVLNVARDCPQPKSCIVEQIERAAAILKSGAPKVERAEALKFLAHFVGDIHQPLHTAVIGDQGGNAIKVTFLGKQSNLHAVWDYALLEAPPPPPDLAYPHLKAALHTLNRKRWKNGTPLEWAQETHWLMRTPATGYLGNPGGFELGQVYVRQNYGVAVDQVEKAGVRLAVILEDVFK